MLSCYLVVAGVICDLRTFVNSLSQARGQITETACFSVNGLFVWNSLPHDLRLTDISECLQEETESIAFLFDTDM